MQGASPWHESRTHPLTFGGVCLHFIPPIQNGSKEEGVGCLHTTVSLPIKLSAWHPFQLRHCMAALAINGWTMGNKMQALSVVKLAHAPHPLVVFRC